MYQVQWHICEDNTDMKLQWNQIDWKKAEEQVNRLQIRIVKATLEQKLRLVKRLQYLITNSFYAKALAVKRVVSNRGKKTPGIDGEFWKSDKEKVNAVRSLDCQTYHAKHSRITSALHLRLSAEMASMLSTPITGTSRNSTKMYTVK